MMKAFAALIALYRREPAATQAAAAIVWGGWVAIDRAFIQHKAPVDWQVVAAAIFAAYGLLVRAQVIPTVKVAAVTIKPKGSA